MANRTRKGIRWVASDVGGTCPREMGRVASAYATALYEGQPVKKLDSGYFDLCAAGEVVYGVIAAIDQFYDANSGRITKPLSTTPKKLPAATSYTGQQNESRLIIIPVVGQIFEIEGATALTVATRAGAIALEGSNADHIISSDDCTLSIVDAEAKDGTPASAQWRIISHVEDPDTDFASARVKFRVRCNEPQFIASGIGL